MGAKGLKSKAIEAYADARRQADRVLDRTGLKPVTKEYEAEVGRAMHSLTRAFRGQMRHEATAGEATKAVANIWFHGSGFATKPGAALESSTRTVLVEGFRSTSTMISKVTGMSTPLDDPTVMSRLVAQHLPKLEKIRAHSAIEMSKDLRASVSAKLRGIAAEDGARVSDLIAAAGETLDHNMWRVERLVRTETSYAMNLAQRAALMEIARDSEFKGLFQRWTERVSDLNGKRLDKKVGEDSLALHGQVAKPGGLFHMPSDAPVGNSLMGRSWEFPPNRPNDRAIITPWMRSWGVPGWLIQGGRRVHL